MPQMGFDPPAQSDTSYEADALPPSHHGWTNVWPLFFCQPQASFSWSLIFLEDLIFVGLFFNFFIGPISQIIS